MFSLVLAILLVIQTSLINCQTCVLGHQRCSPEPLTSFQTCVFNRWVDQQCVSGTRCMTHPHSENRIICNYNILDCSTDQQSTQICRSETEYETCDNGRRVVQSCSPGSFCKYDAIADKIKCIFTVVPVHLYRPLSTVRPHFEDTARNKPPTTEFKTNQETSKLATTAGNSKDFCGDLKKLACSYCGAC